MFPHDVLHAKILACRSASALLMHPSPHSACHTIENLYVPSRSLLNGSVDPSLASALYHWEGLGKKKFRKPLKGEENFHCTVLVHNLILNNSLTWFILNIWVEKLHDLR